MVDDWQAFHTRIMQNSIQLFGFQIILVFSVFCFKTLS